MFSEVMTHNWVLVTISHLFNALDRLFMVNILWKSWHFSLITCNLLIFRYDHLRKEASELAAADTDRLSEPWRSALEGSFSSYVHVHYKYGVPTVYGTSENGNITLIACVESHQFNPKNFWYVPVLICLSFCTNSMQFFILWPSSSCSLATP